MPLRIASFVDETHVPLVKRGGPGNPEVAEITAQLIEAAEAGNTQFAFIPIEDKIERKRIGESIRNQAKTRGYNVEKVTGTRSRKLKGKPAELQQGLFIRASKSLVDMEETPRRNGKG